MGVKERTIKGISTSLTATYESVIGLDFSWDIEPIYLLNYLTQEAVAGGNKLEEAPLNIKIPKNMNKVIAEKAKTVTAILEVFGYTFKDKKERPAKAQHRWTKEIATIDFLVDYNGAKASCRWQKRNELLIKKGASLVKEIPLNKDGTIGFAAKFTLSIRELYKDKIKDFVTTEDIILKSVNEVGNFLYFAGTNSWRILKDQAGKTLDEYTLVK